MLTLENIIEELQNYDGKPIKIMEVCGTHTASIFKNGIRSLISDKIKLISGPGCPVCVTTPSYIDRLAEISLMPDCCVLTFGDMMKVKGSEMSLTEAKAAGGDVRILYSPLMSIKIAQENPNKEFVFAAVGFETTAPIYAILMEEIEKNSIKNLRLLTSLKTIVPALSFVCEAEKNIDAFLCPGHVSVIIGADAYIELAERYRKPFVVAGFEGEHILSAVYEIVLQLEAGEHKMKNMYKNAVSEKGNLIAMEKVNKYFTCADDTWRGIGVIENSALRLRPEFIEYDAGSDIGLEDSGIQMPKGCSCADVILGRINPVECPLFGKTCTPLNAVGPCMVSSEGACGIWYKNRRM
ncbi:hydrogenase formation protein HypD [Parasporobacterium paucivorans]|uniref:Hydrogenase expression/formation protein HypD n=1 Tax=Parasporobacterium paucivorans DSM 15970 TaxID=1122934 RepID=A0A1M6KYL9_9FIRM|nr:hydrogenase formation protein HypD [Parasporobacterium paucivorans]SHJ64065.1 hydrogenase expression/formation protein HypD [Parasporobacterium paucivorans DSM 15970]